MDQESPKKKVRKRTKKLLNLVQKQIEFYFGDANLRHDRFLRKEIENSEDGYVSFSLMLKFNKLKQLTSDVAMLKKAIENSNLFQINEHGDQFKMIQNLPEQIDPDKKTVYVEQLHGYCDHDWLKQVFSICGTVEYISLPRYKHNNQIKGFAFIEFSTEEEADKACQFLNTAAPRNKSKTKKQRQSVAQQSHTTNKKEKEKHENSSDMETNQKENKSLKRQRKRSSSVSFDGSPIKQKHMKLIEITKKNNLTFTENKTDSVASKKSQENEIVGNVCTEKKTQLKRKNKDSPPQGADDNGLAKNETFNLIQTKKLKTIEGVVVAEKSDKVLDIENELLQDDNLKKKKARKRKKKDAGVKEISVPPLYVITKNEWSSLKKQYKNLQRKEMRDLKRNTKILKSEKVRILELKEKHKNTLQEIPSQDLRCDVKNFSDKNIVDKPNEKAQSTSRSRPQCEIKEGNEKPKVKSLDMKPGTVVALKSDSESLNKKDIMNELSSKVLVTYVDYINGNPTGYVRFPSSEIVSEILQDKCTQSKFTLSKLTVQEEKDYFEKALEDQRKKYEENQRKKNRKKKIGVNKIIDYSELPRSHVHFS